MLSQRPLDRTRRDLLGLGTGLALLAISPARTFGQGSAGNKINIGVIGSGHIGGTIGSLWVKAGHAVMFSSRHPDELKGLVAELGPSARAGGVKEAMAFGEALLIAVPY